MELNLKNSQQLSLLSLLSLLFGYLAGKRLSHRQILTSSVILDKVKRAFRHEAPIEGAWINSQPINHQQFAIKSLVYTGGVTRYEDQQLTQYEFMADAKTGSILNITRL